MCFFHMFHNFSIKFYETEEISIRENILNYSLLFVKTVNKKFTKNVNNQLIFASIKYIIDMTEKYACFSYIILIA